MTTHDEYTAPADDKGTSCQRGIVLFDDRFWVGILIGSAIGISAGILLAPKSGKKTMRDISNSVKTVATEAQDKLEDVKENITDGVSAVKDKISETAVKAKNELEHVVEKGKAIEQKGRQLVEDIGEDIHRAGI